MGLVHICFTTSYVQAEVTLYSTTQNCIPFGTRYSEAYIGTDRYASLGRTLEECRNLATERKKRSGTYFMLKLCSRIGS